MKIYIRTLICLFCLFFFVSCNGSSSGTSSDEVPEPWSPVKVKALGNNLYEISADLTQNDELGIKPDDVYVVGWNGSWETFYPMTPMNDYPGWVEVTLESDGIRIQSFGIRNFDGTAWFWSNPDDYPLHIPSSWIDPNAESHEKTLAFWAKSNDSYQYITEPLDMRALEILPASDNQNTIRVNLFLYSDIPTDDACIIGWNGSWETLYLMTPMPDRPGWVEITLENNEQIQRFTLTDGDAANWLWLGKIRTEGDEISKSFVVPFEGNLIIELIS